MSERNCPYCPGVKYPDGCPPCARFMEKHEALVARAEKAEAERDVLIRHMSESPVCTDCACPVARERGDSCPAVGMPIGGHDCEGHIRQWAEREAAKAKESERA